MVRSLPEGSEPAICYSGFREGQSPDAGVFPTEEQVQEDLHLLKADFRHLRLYDCDPHAEMVLRLIERDELDFTVMLGAYIAAEKSNPNCPWGGVYDDAQLERNRLQNEARIEQLAVLANRYPKIVSSVSAGNEACVEWTDHLVPVERVIEYVRTLRASVSQPVTFCENYLPWLNELRPLAAEVDFISLHTYPVWEYKPIAEGIDYTIDNFTQVAEMHPGKPIVITEAGWPTQSNGRGIPPENAGEAEQATYLRELTQWSREHGVLTYLFEAFDEPWKGSDHPSEPEKHWGIYSVDRTPKLALRPRAISPHLREVG